MKKLLVLFLVGLFCISLVNAGAFDFNKKTFDKSVGEYGKVTIDDWFGFGKQAEFQLTKNTKICPEGNCEALIPEFIMHEKGVLIEDIRFIGNQPQSYQIYVNDKSYKVGTEVNKGTYNVRIEGNLKILQTTDWQIKVAGIWIEEYALWTSSDGLKMYYALDETSGVVVDRLGLNNGTNSGADRGIAGILNNSFDFEKSENDYVDIPQTDYTDFTVNAWLNPETNFEWAWGTIVADQDGDDRITIKTSDGVTLHVNGVEYIGTGLTSHPGQWKMYTFIRVGNQFMVYINGTQIGVNDTVNTDTFTLDSIARRQGASSIGYFDGKMDEIGFWNRSLSEDEIFELYNGGGGLGFGATEIITTLNAPDDNTLFLTPNILFNASSNVGVVTISNMSLWTNQSGTFEPVNFTTGLSGTSNESTWNHNLGGEGNYLWNVQSCDSDGDCGFASTNRTVSVDSTSPIVDITYPTTLINFHEGGNNISLNWTVSDANLDSCWYEYQGINTTVTCLDLNVSIELSDYNNRTINFWVNDSLNNFANDSSTWIYNLWEDSQTYDASVTEGSTGNFTAIDKLYKFKLEFNHCIYMV